MYYLSVDDVIVIHDDFVKSFGGALGIRDDNLLESAVFRCQASFGGVDLYKTIFEKAAAIMHALLFDHPFVDGNKRASLGCAVEFLEQNGWVFTVSNPEAVAFPLAVEQTRPDILEIAAWFKSHCRKVSKKNRS